MDDPRRALNYLKRNENIYTLSFPGGNHGIPHDQALYFGVTKLWIIAL